MKLYRGKWKYARRHYYGSMSMARLQWALSLKPGDYISTCEGCNRYVTSIKVTWCNDGRWRYGKSNKHSFIEDVEFTDSKGRVHYLSGHGCVMPQESEQELMQGYHEGLQYWEGHELTERQQMFKEALESGKTILDCQGELLPEFDRY